MKCKLEETGEGRALRGNKAESVTETHVEVSFHQRVESNWEGSTALTFAYVQEINVFFNFFKLISSHANKQNAAVG